MIRPAWKFRGSVHITGKTTRSVPGPTETLVQWYRLGPCFWIRVPNLEADQSPPASAEVNKEWRCAFTTLIHPHGADRDFFFFYLFPFLREDKRFRTDWLSDFPIFNLLLTLLCM